MTAMRIVELWRYGDLDKLARGRIRRTMDYECGNGIVIALSLSACCGRYVYE
jgi:hypothetical protein